MEYHQSRRLKLKLSADDKKFEQVQKVPIFCA